jgi:hypothetical protein
MLALLLAPEDKESSVRDAARPFREENHIFLRGRPDPDGGAIGSPAWACTAACHAGYWYLLRDRRAEALACFDRALQTRRVDQFEYRMAQVEAARLR